MYSLSSNSSYCPLSSPDSLQSLSLSAHVGASFGGARLGESLVRQPDGSLDIISKSAAFVMGERILQPVVHKAAGICYSIFTHIRAGFNRLDSAFGRAVALPQVEAAETTTEPTVKSIVSTVRRAQNCLSKDCPSIDKSKLHPREIVAIESGFISYWSWATGNAKFEISQEWLRLRKDDPRPKVLYLTAEEDHNEALAPETVYNLMKSLNEEFDIKYRVVKTYAEICSEIRWAAKIGGLETVIIDGHGYADSRGIVLSKKRVLNVVTSVESINRSSDFSSCFAPLPVNKKIILTSCYGGMAKEGSDPRDSFAQHLATRAKRIVVAATDAVYGRWTGIESIKDIEIIHPPSAENKKKFGWFSHSNLFQEFIPQYPTCPNVNSYLTDRREISAAVYIDSRHFVRNFIRRKNIKTPMSVKDIKDHVPSFEDIQDSLRLCKEDPKSKFLFLSSKQDASGALDPASMPDFLSDIADGFDIKFKVIESEYDICKEVNGAAKIGEIGAVLIHSHGTPERLSLSSFSWSEWAYDVIFGKNGQFPDCLSKIPLSARIILLGGSTGSAVEGDPLNNLAHKIAAIANRTVLASTGPVYASKLTLTSSNPVKIYHPAKSSSPSSPFSGKNSFLTFTPPDENDEL